MLKHFLVKNLFKWIFAVFAWALMLFVNGAVPFLSSPTLGQAVWTTGFSLSFIQESLLSIHATNFGNPNPAAIAFGLAGAYPAGLLIILGLHPSDAYSLMAAVWLTVAFWGAWRIGRFLGVTSSLASLGALLWTSTPVIWNHAGYSMVSFGIALLPFYFSIIIILLFRIINMERVSFTLLVGYFLSTTISVFMDGYSFMMFAAGSSILGCYALFRYKESRPKLIKHAIPIHILSFGLAYLLFTLYIGKAHFTEAPLDFFRGWGLDLSFVAIPTKGVLWLWDTLGLSIPRSSTQFFGDASVWITTFSLPLIIFGLLAWVLTRKKSKLATCFLIIAILGFYMALGPSLKIDSTKPDYWNSPLMPAELAIAPTGSALLSEYVPGFNNMRAAYRWSALGMFGFWALILLLLAQRRSIRSRSIVILIIFFLIVNNFPDLSHQWQEYKNNRSMFLKIDNDLVEPLSKDLKAGEKVVFLPYRNDFLVNYLAPKLEIKTFNIGGDKNLEEARENWPTIMKEFKMSQIDTGFSTRIAHLLIKGEVDVVVLPYIDLLWAAHSWPAANSYQAQIEQIVKEFETSKLFKVQNRRHYSVIRLDSLYKNTANLEVFLKKLPPRMLIPPFGFNVTNFPDDYTFQQVGRIENGSIYTTKQAGFLSFGPYVPFDAGHYHLTVKGEVGHIEDAWVDIVSHKGTRQYAKLPIQGAESNLDNVLVSADFTLDESVEDLEVRIYVSSSEIIRLDGYELIKVSSEN